MIGSLLHTKIHLVHVPKVEGKVSNIIHTFGTIAGLNYKIVFPIHPSVYIYIILKKQTEAFHIATSHY